MKKQYLMTSMECWLQWTIQAHEESGTNQNSIWQVRFTSPHLMITTGQLDDINVQQI